MAFCPFSRVYIVSLVGDFRVVVTLGVVESVCRFPICWKLLDVPIPGMQLNFWYSFFPPNPPHFSQAFYSIEPLYDFISIPRSEPPPTILLPDSGIDADYFIPIQRSGSAAVAFGFFILS